MGPDHGNDRVAAKRLFVLHTAPSHPLSAPDPHITLKLLSSELKSLPSEADAEETEESQS